MSESADEGAINLLVICFSLIYRAADYFQGLSTTFVSFKYD